VLPGGIVVGIVVLVAQGCRTVRYDPVLFEVARGADPVGRRDDRRHLIVAIGRGFLGTGWKISGRGRAEELVVLVPALEEVAAPRVATGKLTRTDKDLHIRGVLSLGVGTPAILCHPSVLEIAAIGAFSLLASHAGRPLHPTVNVVFSATTSLSERPHDVAILPTSGLQGWRRCSVSIDCSHVQIRCLQGTVRAKLCSTTVYGHPEGVRTARLYTKFGKSCIRRRIV